MHRGMSCVVLLASAIGSSLIGCDDVDVFLPDERKALEAYESISEGSTEGEVRARLGPPSCVVDLEHADSPTLVARCPEDAEPRTLPRDNRKDWPREMLTLMPEVPTRRVLLYADDTVFAQYFFDDAGRVVLVHVAVS